MKTLTTKATSCHQSIYSQRPHEKELIINHNSTDISRISTEFIKKAKKIFKIAYGHTSHGSQIISGMEALQKKKHGLFCFNRDGKNGALSIWDYTPEGDLGNPDRSTWAARTRELLNGEGGSRNLVIWSWCGQVGRSSEEDINLYLKLMSDLEKEFPNVIFVYMTGHLNGSGSEGILYQRNQQIREFCKKNKKVLFDFADIESYKPNGRKNYDQLCANDNCDYKNNGRNGNWAIEWLKQNPDSDFALPEIASHTQPLNAAMKGQAFWFMLGRLAEKATN